MLGSPWVVFLAEVIPSHACSIPAAFDTLSVKKYALFACVSNPLCQSLECLRVSTARASPPSLPQGSKGKSQREPRQTGEVQQQNKSQGNGVRLPPNLRLRAGGRLWRTTPGEGKGDMIASISSMEVRRSAVVTGRLPFVAGYLYIFQRA